jgi:hypothetical protein
MPNLNTVSSFVLHDSSWNTPDWRREQPSRFWDPSRKLLKAIRDYQRMKKRGALGRWLSKLCVLRYRFCSVVTGADYHLTARLKERYWCPTRQRSRDSPECGDWTQLLALSASNHNGKCNTRRSCRCRSRSKNYWAATNRRPRSYRSKRRCLARCPFRSDCRWYTRPGSGEPDGSIVAAAMMTVATNPAR